MNLVKLLHTRRENDPKGEIDMKKFGLLLILLLLTLTACGTSENAENQDATEKNETTEESTNAAKEDREITEEDEKFTKMLLDKDYDGVIAESVSLKTDSQKNFYYLASALRKYEEIQTKDYVDATTNDKNYNDMVTDYNVVAQYLGRASYVPDELAEDIDTVKSEAEEKAAEYQAELDKQAENQ